MHRRYRRLVNLPEVLTPLCCLAALANYSGLFTPGINLVPLLALLASGSSGDKG